MCLYSSDSRHQQRLIDLFAHSFLQSQLLKYPNNCVIGRNSFIRAHYVYKTIRDDMVVEAHTLSSTGQCVDTKYSFLFQSSGGTHLINYLVI